MAFLALPAVLFVAFLLAAFKAFFAMLLFGAVHHQVFEWVPALGFWQTLLVVLLVAAVLPSDTDVSTNK